MLRRDKSFRFGAMRDVGCDWCGSALDPDRVAMASSSLGENITKRKLVNLTWAYRF